jgi:hypothetical protein
LSLVVLLALACTEPTPPTEPLDLPEGCNPLLAGTDCFLPYPSDVFLVDDDSLPSGKRVQMSGAAKLVTAVDTSGDVNEWWASDGFSRMTPIVALLDTPVDPAQLVGIFDDWALSQRADSKTLLIEADTGHLVPHFTDVDPRSEDEHRRALVLRPQESLREQTRYVVALQNLTTPEGALAPPAEGFRRLRDGEVDDEPALTALAARYDADVFDVLEAQGVDRADLQLAWDFTTQSEQRVTEDMFRVRELVLTELDAAPPTVEVTAVFENDQDEFWRTIYGEITGPMVLQNIGANSPLFRDADGRAALNGTVSFPFIAVVPNSVKDRFEPGVTIDYGHGFFGLRWEVDYSKQRRLFDAVGGVAFGIDWWGMMEDDVGAVVSTIGYQVSESLSFSDRIYQAMANHLTLTAALDGAMRDVPELRRPSDPTAEGVVEDPSAPGSNNAGALLYGDEVTYVGISQGHILGGVHAALNPHIDRYVLQVGGSGFTQMMMRAAPFLTYLDTLEVAVPDPLEQQKVMASMQMQFDRVDPGTYAPFVLDRPVPFGPLADAHTSRRVLLQTALGDTAVPNFTSFLHARQLGVPLLAPSPRNVFELSQATAPVEGSAISVWDLGEDESWAEVPVPVEEEDETRSHDDLRKQPEARAQIRTFLETGVIEHTCDGPCVFPDPVD